MSQKLVVICRLKDGTVRRGTYPYLSAISRKMVFENDPRCESINLYEQGFEPAESPSLGRVVPTGSQPQKGQDKGGEVGSGQRGSSPRPAQASSAARPHSIFGLRYWSGL